ncbi:MAG: long-chain fatty acid--CoA ligase [Pseudomonadota bacterium]
MRNESFRSVPDMLLGRVAATPNGEAFRYPEGGRWRTLLWKDVLERARAIAGGLRSLGLKNEERCAILCTTRIEWILADLGIMCGGGATTTIYPTSTAEECAYIVNDSSTVFVFAEDDGQVAKLEQRRNEVPHLRKVIVLDGSASDDGWVVTLKTLMEQGVSWDAEDPGRFEQICQSISPNSLATLIYTSGTTGLPKGVELPHDCWIYEGEGIDALGLLHQDDLQYLWLPLAHSFGKAMIAAQLRIGFPTAVDGRIDKLVENLAVIRPTFICAVPRIYEKVHNRVVTSAKAGGSMKRRIFSWALAVGQRVSTLRQQKNEPTPLLALKHALADRLVFSKIRARFGGRLRFFVSGAAPLSRELAEFFHAAGVVILEGYGLTESSAVTCVNRLDHVKFGTVGPPIPGTELRCAEDGEILIRGRGVMRCYHNLPDETDQTFDHDGWLRTGDIGRIDADGHLEITDRKKDLIKTAGGKYVAPQALEVKLKTICPYVSQILVHGNRRSFCSALVTIDEEAVKGWACRHNLGSLASDNAEKLAQRPEIVALVQRYIDRLNATVANHETIRRFAILPNDLTQESGDLTPSLKVKRKTVENKYKQFLDSFYTESGPVCIS